MSDRKTIARAGPAIVLATALGYKAGKTDLKKVTNTVSEKAKDLLGTIETIRETVSNIRGKTPTEDAGSDPAMGDNMNNTAILEWLNEHATIITAIVDGEHIVIWHPDDGTAIEDMVSAHISEGWLKDRGYHRGYGLLETFPCELDPDEMLTISDCERINNGRNCDMIKSCHTYTEEKFKSLIWK